MVTSRGARPPAEFGKLPGLFGRNRQVEHREPSGNSQTAASRVTAPLLRILAGHEPEGRGRAWFARAVLRDRTREAAKIAPIAPYRVGAAVHVRGMVHGEQDHTVDLDGRGTGWGEGPSRSRQFAPRDVAKARDHARPCDRKFRPQVIAAIGDLAGVGVAIAPQFVARVTAHQVGDENAGEPRLGDHLVEQLARTIAAEGQAGSITTVTAGGDPDKHDRGGNRSGAGNRLGAATHECVAAHAGAHPGLKIGESKSSISPVMQRPIRHAAGHLTWPG